jgi:hypothetical protein
VTEQTEQDFRDIERARDLPDDEPYPSRDDEDVPGDAEAEELYNAVRYGTCAVCGRVRFSRKEVNGLSTHVSLRCPEGHDQ